MIFDPFIFFLSFGFVDIKIESNIIPPFIYTWQLM